MQPLAEQPLVSVVIASYNMGEYLRSAVRSVCDGEFRNIEVIVIDDGSTDNTNQSIQPCLEDSRVRYVYQDNQGQSKAKNHGVRIATGDYIAFCDADDLWTPDKLMHQMPCFTLSPKIGVVSSNSSFIDDRGYKTDSPKVERYSGNITHHLMINNFISFGTSVVRRACFDKVGMFDESLPMGIDWDFWLRVSLHYEFYHLEEVTYHYRVWSGQMSTDFRGRYKYAERILSRFVRDNPGVVSDAVIRDAWADLYARKGRAIYFREGERVVALRAFFKALCYKPWSLLTWKSIARLLLGLRNRGQSTNTSIASIGQNGSRSSPDPKPARKLTLGASTSERNE